MFQRLIKLIWSYVDTPCIVKYHQGNFLWLITQSPLQQYLSIVVLFILHNNSIGETISIYLIFVHMVYLTDSPSFVIQSDWTYNNNLVEWAADSPISYWYLGGQYFGQPTSVDEPKIGQETLAILLSYPVCTRVSTKMTKMRLLTMAVSMLKQEGVLYAAY